MYNEYYPSYLIHHGIKGQRWGDRKYQNLDGSLTPEGRIRYGQGKGIGIGSNTGSMSSSINKKIASNNVSTFKKQKFKLFDVSKDRGNYLIERSNRKHLNDSYDKQVNRARRKIIIRRFGGLALPNIGQRFATIGINAAGNYLSYKTNGKFKWNQYHRMAVRRAAQIISAIQTTKQVTSGVNELRAVNNAAKSRSGKNIAKSKVYTKKRKNKV